MMGPELEVAQEALRLLVDTVVVTGGIVPAGGGSWAPACDPEWVDLGQAYLLACGALGEAPSVGLGAGR